MCMYVCVSVCVVCACTCACVRACVRACMRAWMCLFVCGWVAGVHSRKPSDLSDPFTPVRCAHPDGIHREASSTADRLVS